MAKKVKTKEVTINASKGALSILKKQGTSKKDYNFKDLTALRRLLSNEKARMLSVIKTEAPGSIYGLAKKLKRNFKSVRKDVKLLEKFGFIKLVEEKTKNRKRYRPEVAADSVVIKVKI